MRRALAWVAGRRQAAFTAVVVQSACVALLLAACDMGTNAGPLPTQMTTVTAASTGAPPTEGSTPILASPTPVALAKLSTADLISIYGLAVADLLKSETAKNVYISPYVGQGERLDSPNQAVPVPNTLDSSLQLSDKSRSYQLVEFADAVGALEDGGKVKNSGVFLTLGQVTADTTGVDVVQVRGSIYRGVGNSLGNIYRFRRDPATNNWELTGVTSDWKDQR